MTRTSWIRSSLTFRSKAKYIKIAATHTKKEEIKHQILLFFLGGGGGQVVNCPPRPTLRRSTRHPPTNAADKTRPENAHSRPTCAPHPHPVHMQMRFKRYPHPTPTPPPAPPAAAASRHPAADCTLGAATLGGVVGGREGLGGVVVGGWGGHQTSLTGPPPEVPLSGDCWRKKENRSIHLPWA